MTGEKIVEILLGYGPAGVLYIISASHLISFLNEGGGEWKQAIIFAVLGSVAAFFSQAFKAGFEPLANQLGKFVSTRLLEGVQFFWLSITSPFQRKYYKALLYEFSDYRTQGLRLSGSTVLQLETMFVPLGITSQRVETISAGLLQTDEGEEPNTIWDFLADGLDNPPLRHLALLAPPGSGKTTLLKHLILSYARNVQRQHHRKAPRLTPIYISLRDVREVVVRSRPSLPRLIERQPLIRKAVPPKDWIETRLNRGKCLVMFDGLDEVADVGDRQAISQWMNEQIRAYPENYFLLASRPLGYQSAPLEAVGRVLKVEPFSLDRIQQFINNWYLQNELLRRPRAAQSANRTSRRTARRTARKKAIDLFERIKDSSPLAAMALNPLLLTMMTTVHDYRAVLPANRVRLYAVIYEVLIEQRQRDRNIYDEAIATTTRQVLQHLALAMMEYKTQEYRVADDTLNLQNSLSQLLNQLFEKGLSLEEFLTQTESAHGLLVKKADGVYEFAHESFQHYLAAVQLQALGRETELLQHVSDDWWFDTLYLYAADQGDATAIVEAALGESTVESLNLAYTLAQDGIPMADEAATRLRKKIDDSLRSSDAAIFRLAAEVMLSNRLNGLLRLSDRLEIDPQHLTQAEYQLFLDDWGQSLQPDHWATDRFQPDQAQAPIVGVRARDAEAFCEWLTHVRSKPGIRYRVPRLMEIKGSPSKEAGTGCWCTDLPGLRVAGLQQEQWSAWQVRLGHLLNEYVERDRPRVRDISQSPDLEITLDLQSDTGFRLAIDPALDLDRALGQLYATNLTRALALARSRPFSHLDGERSGQSPSTSTSPSSMHQSVRLLLRAVTIGRNYPLNRNQLLNRELSQTRDFGAVRAYLLLVAEFWQVLADAHALLGQERRNQQVIRFMPEPLARMLAYPFMRVRSECIAERDRTISLYAFFVLLEARRDGQMPAWEGIRIVREVVRRD